MQNLLNQILCHVASSVVYNIFFSLYIYTVCSVDNFYR